MAQVEPFAALRPKPDLAARICELPYDVMSSAEARELAAGNPLSFLHVSKPEIDLAAGTDLYSPEVYAKGKENFDKLIAEGALRQDAQPCFYFYRQIMGKHAQVGFVAAASCEEYLNNIIKKHEFTRPDKEDDRVRHIETLEFADRAGVPRLIAPTPRWIELRSKSHRATPDIDFTAKDGVRHTAWVVRDARPINVIRKRVRAHPRSLHCRRASSQRGGRRGFIKSRKGAGQSGYFPERHFSAQPDADSAVQPRVEGFERH